MPAAPAPPAPARPAAAELNAAIRRLCAGRWAWSDRDRALLAELQAQWRDAVEAERDPARATSRLPVGPELVAAPARPASSVGSCPS